MAKKKRTAKKAAASKKAAAGKTATRKQTPKKKKTRPPGTAERDLNGELATVFENTTLPAEDARLVEAIQANAKAVAKVLPGVANINKRIGGKNGFTPLMLACYVAPDSVPKALLAAGADPKLDPVLLVTTWKKTLTRLLLKAGADPHVTNGEETPLSGAVDLGEREVAKLLLDAGAEVTEFVKKTAKRIDDAGMNKLLGLTEPAPAKLYVPPLLAKPLKKGYRKIYQVTGLPPLGVDGLSIFRCQIEPDRFLDAKAALAHSSADKAANIVLEQLGSVEGCEFVRSDMFHDSVLMLGSNNKFYYWKKPKKLLDWLKLFDAKHSMSFVSLYSETSTFRFSKKLTKSQCDQWQKSWKALGLDAVTAQISNQQLILSYEIS